MSRWISAAVAVAAVCAAPLFAQEHITQAKASFIFNGERVKIDRESAQGARFVDRFATRPGAQGASQIAPMQAAAGVKTVDETEVLGFFLDEVATNKGLVVDARMPEDRALGFIPGTVSLPHATMSPDNSFRKDILRALGAREFDGVFNFADARTLLVYDTGPSSDDAGVLITQLLAEGYPADKLRYYRGGMQVWSVLGFSIEEGTS